MIFKRAFLYSFVISAGLGLAFLAGYFTYAAINPRPDQFPIFDQAYSILEDNALDPLLPSPAIEYGMIRGLLQAYGDPYSVFVEPVQHELETNSLQGSFGGIGVRFGRDEAGIITLYPFPNGPAAQAGVLEGDRLAAIDELEITPKTSLEAVEAASRGPEGQSVLIKVLRPPDFKHLEYRIKRQAFPLPSVTWHLDPHEPGVGVIEVNIIAASTPDEIQIAVTDLQNRGAVEYILDLRNNGGGLLTSGVDTARLFLKDGLVIRQHYRGHDIESFEVKKPGPLADIPLAVLVNQGTASAAEIIAGVLQAHDRAVLVGVPTYGKYTIQYVFDLKDGSSLHVTAGRWWIPEVSDQLIDPPKDIPSLQPEIQVSSEATGRDPFITAAIQALLALP